MPAYKDTDRGTWYAKFYYTDWTGQKKVKKKRGFKKKSEALDFEREFLNKQQMDCDMPFKSLVDVYFEDMKTRLKASTMSTKEYIVVNKILPYFAELPINTIKAPHIRKWQNELLSKNYSPTYVKTVNNQLSAIFNYAVRYYDLKDNPCHKAGSIGKGRADDMGFWTLEEFNTVISYVNDNAAKTALILFFYSGMRCGELLALTANDFDFQASTVTITKSYTRLNGKDYITEPKTPKSKRIITLPTSVTETIKDYIDTLYNLDPTDRLFPYTKHFFRHTMERACKKSGVKKIRVHDLRHSHASLLIEMGINILIISQRLGHEKVETTLGTYSHLYPNKHEEVANQLESLKKRSK